MSGVKRVLINRQPQTPHQTMNGSYENDGMLYDYQDDALPKERSVNSPSNIDLIRTRDIDRQRSLAKNTSSSYTLAKGFLIVGGILLLLSTVVVVPTVLLVRLTRNPTVVNNSTTTTIAPTVVTAYWSFDNNANDMYGTYNGVVGNSASYSSTNTYFGYGYYLTLTASSNQYVTVSSPFFNLSYTSFTVEAWIYGTTLTGDNTVFAQCQCTSCQDQCLYLIIRNNKMYMGFTLDDVTGVTTLLVNTWYHVAYVYDYSARTQSLYLQGVLDNSKTSAGPYQGSSGSIYIGSSQLLSNSFNGYIDNLKLTTRAKSAVRILADASIVAHFSFDGSSLSQDVGPNGMNGSLSNAAAVTGRVGQGLAFSGSLSYFQAYGFYQLGQSNQAFSFALWVYPYSVAGGTLIHISITPQYVNNTWCQDVMGFTGSGQIAFHTSTAGTNVQITGPFVSTMQWTHIVFTYSSTNGQTAYINGVKYLNTGAFSFSSSTVTDWITIGYGFVYCGVSPINTGYYFGAIDEFYVYRRELSASDVYSLANP